MSWYSRGIPFQCQSCGKCCQGKGFVHLSLEDMEKISQFLSLDIKKFQALYTRQEGDKILLKDSPGTDDCIFLSQNKCTIYLARPIQCQTFPWWPSFLESPTSWKHLVKNCKGAHQHKAPIISEKEINEKAESCKKHIS
ncbi:MAG: YkgJ family cysteine cluster protein [Chlamydiota bacterium]